MNVFRYEEARSQPFSGPGLRRLFDVGTTTGRIGRLLALGVTGAVLVAATPVVVPEAEDDSGLALPRTSPATDQYAEQVTICDRPEDDSDGRTLRLTAGEAASLLQENSSAAQGPC